MTPLYCLAPMEGVTDTVFRRVVMKAGRPDLMFTEFTSVEGLLSRGYTYVADRLVFDASEQPLIAQIWGTKPEQFFQTAKLLKAKGFAGININMGCPVREVVRLGAGAALIENPDLAVQIIRATREGAGKLPISVKSRLGLHQNNIEKWTRILLGEKLETIIIHGRTAKELSKVPAHWEEIKKAVEIRDAMGVKTLIIGNGDVESLSDADKKVKKYKVDGVMIGRGVLKNPWVFDRDNKPKSKQNRMALLTYHMDLFELV